MTKMRQVALRLLKLCTFISTLSMMWKGLTAFANTKYPVVVLYSSTASPTFELGDVLFLMNNTPTQINDLCLIQFPGRSLLIPPIIHRIVKLHINNTTMKEYIVTKGDDIVNDDRMLLGQEGELWIHREDIVGKIKGYIPFIGKIYVSLSNRNLFF